jgi:hypothetical protein
MNSVDSALATLYTSLDIVIVDVAAAICDALLSLVDADVVAALLFDVVVVVVVAVVEVASVVDVDAYDVNADGTAGAADASTTGQRNGQNPNNGWRRKYEIARDEKH